MLILIVLPLEMILGFERLIGFVVLSLCSGSNTRVARATSRADELSLCVGDASPRNQQPSSSSSCTSSSLAAWDGRGNDVQLSRYKGKVLLIVIVASQCGFTNTNYTGLSELYNKYKDQASNSEKGCTSSKDPKSSSSRSSRKHQEAAAGGEQRVDLGLPTAIDLGAGKKAAAKAQNGGECKCEAATANVIIISIEISNGRAVKERSRKKKTGGGPTFTSFLTARSKDLIIVNIDEAFGDDELAVAEYAEDIYKFYKLTEGESQVCDYMGMQPDIDERMRSILVD
ncbi:hypothetical protein Dimus_016515 [Dionaea muscipula]